MQLNAESCTLHGIRYTVYGIRYRVYGVRYRDLFQYKIPPDLPLQREENNFPLWKRGIEGDFGSFSY